MILAFDTATRSCTAALIADDGAVVAAADEIIGRGHAERLAPLLAELLAGRRPTRILVGVGPGSFTGIRVALATAHGLALGWDVPVTGMSTLALIAAGARRDDPALAGSVLTVALAGGHGELFVAAAAPDGSLGEMRNLPPAAAALAFPHGPVVGDGAAALVAARGGAPMDARDGWPVAALAMTLPPALRALPPRPLYGRAPDAKPAAAHAA